MLQLRLLICMLYLKLLMCMLHCSGAQADTHSELAKLTIFGEAEGSSGHLSACYLLGCDSQNTITAYNAVL